jgi:hypothetical protein
MINSLQDRGKSGTDGLGEWMATQQYADRYKFVLLDAEDYERSS